MGQKINPIGLRLGVNRGWDSTWFAKKKDFGKYLIEDFKIRNYIKKILQIQEFQKSLLKGHQKNALFQFTLPDRALLLEKKVLILKKSKKIS